MSAKSNITAPAPSAEKAAETTMTVRKRNGTVEPIDVNKVLRAVSRASEGIQDVDPARVAFKTIGGLYDGASTQELDLLSIKTASSLITEEPNYSKLAASLLSEYIRKEVVSQNVQSFSQSVLVGHETGLINDRLADFVKANARKLNNAIVEGNDSHFEFFGLRTVYDRYLLKHPTTRKVIETPQFFMLRVASALSNTVTEAIELYKLISNMHYIPSTPTSIIMSFPGTLPFPKTSVMRSSGSASSMSFRAFSRGSSGGQLVI